MSKPGFSVVDSAGWICVIALSAGGYVAVGQPLVRNRLQTAGLLRTAEETRQQVQDIRNQSSVLDREIQKQTIEARELSKNLRPVDQLNTRLEVVSNIAAKHDLKVLIMSPGAPVDRTGYATVPIRLGGLGVYAASVAFLSDLAAEMPDFAVEHVDLGGNLDDPQRDPRFEIDLVWFAERPAQAAKAEHPAPAADQPKK